MPLSAELLLKNVEVSTVLQQRVDMLYGPLLEALPSPSERDFARRAVLNLLRVSGEIKTHTDLLPTLEDVEDSLKRWLSDETHGARHSYAVYQRMLELREQEMAAGHTEFAVSDRELEIRALLHDIGEFLPVYTKDNQKINDKDWQFRRHAQLIAMITYRAGKALGAGDAVQLARDLRHHDYYWSRPNPKQAEDMKDSLTPAGRILADGDRLVGEKVEDAIHRSRSISLGKWYFLRKLDAADRAKWKVRTGAIFDGMSAVLTEFSSQDHWFYTETGKKLNRRKQEQFRASLTEYYTKQYRSGWQVLHDALAQGLPVEVGVKGEGPNGFAVVEKNETNAVAEKVELRPEKQFSFNQKTTDDQLRQAFTELLTMPVKEAKKNPQFPDRDYYGYSVRVTTKDGEKVWVDPSILRFQSEQDLEETLMTAVDEYQALFQSGSDKTSQQTE